MVPVQSNIQVTLMPSYIPRSAVEQFSSASFVGGAYNGKGAGGGFISMATYSSSSAYAKTKFKNNQYLDF